VANPEHLAKLKEGFEAFNQWRANNRDVRPDLSRANLIGILRGAYLNKAELCGANLSGAYLNKADLSGANLSGANLRGAYLNKADFSKADLRQADLTEADLGEADLRGANLSGANLRGANLSGILRGAYLREADLRGANLSKADLRWADLSLANLSRADLSGVNLREADLRGADLREADLSQADLGGADLSLANLGRANLSGAFLVTATLVETNLERANLTSCSVYGISVWNVKLEGAIQSNLVITGGKPAIQVDNLEVAQFIYLLLNNERIRHVIDAITSKVVLILGRFTPERKTVLDAIRDQLRDKDYLPELFDFEKPTSKDLTGTVSTLANMARFVIADMTDPSSVPHELATIVPGTVVPVQAIVLEGQREYAMFVDLKTRYHWVLEPYRYTDNETLLAQLDQMVIAPAEAKAKELIRK
jgi:uncharacterized protein YjbI with pentapeptide repeats